MDNNKNKICKTCKFLATGLLKNKPIYYCDNPTNNNAGFEVLPKATKIQDINKHKCKEWGG
jgi:hypothetical protein